MNIVLKILEGTPAIDTTAVDEIIKKITEFLSIPVVTIGGTTLTIGLIIVALIKFFFPKNAIIKNQEETISQLNEENKTLKQKQVENEARIATLEQQVGVVLEFTPNKRVQEAKAIKVLPEQVLIIDANAATKRRVKVKIKKAANAVTEAITNG